MADRGRLDAYSVRHLGVDEGTTAQVLVASGKPALVRNVWIGFGTAGGNLRFLHGDGATRYFPSGATGAVDVGPAAVGIPGGPSDFVVSDGLAIVATAAITAGGYLVSYAQLTL